MKNIIYLIFLSCLLTVSLYGQNNISKNACTLMTDLKADSFIGKVKSVVQSSADLKFERGNENEINKRLSSSVEYDIQGNRTIRNAYSNGKLFLVTNYQKLDIGKVSIQKFINNDDLPVFTVSNAEKDSEKDKDYRFDFKFEYEYDDKCNRIKEFWIQNTGVVWIQDDIEFDSNGRKIKEIRRHSGKDEVSSMTIFKYVEQNHLSEEIHTDKNGDESEKHESTKFDSNGNWIKRIVSRKTNSGNFEPFLVTYRKITYFNQK